MCELVPNVFDRKVELRSDTERSTPKLHLVGHLLSLRRCELLELTREVRILRPHTINEGGHRLKLARSPSSRVAAQSARVPKWRIAPS